MQVPLPTAPKAASGDALLLPSSGRPVLAFSQLLSLASDTLETAIELAQSQPLQGKLLQVTLPDSTEREAALFVAAISTRQLDALLASLPGARLMELASICHRVGCDVLGACKTALLDRIAKGVWLTPDNVLSVMSWAYSVRLADVRLKAAVYAAGNLRDLAIDSKAAESGDDAALVLQCVQRRPLDTTSGAVIRLCRASNLSAAN